MEGRPTCAMEASRSRPRPAGLLATFVALALTLAPAAGAATRNVTPNDRAFSAQWELADNAIMGARTAWGTSTGAGVVVAVLDTGAQLDHPDLAGNLWTNPADGSHGYDFVNHDNDPSDDNGHGTSVAGIIAARGNNGIGVTGVAPQTKLMIVKVLGADGSGDEGQVAAGVLYAVRNGAKIINLSMAGPQDDPTLEAALQTARDAGVLIVAAAGNNGADLDTTPAYPASAPLDNVIAVASTDERGALAGDSGFGRNSVAIAAPGEDIDSTATGGRYGVRSGTSQAAAHVSGVLALELAAKPGATAQELRAALLAGARRTTLPVASGALDAAGALRALAGNARRLVKRTVTTRTRTRAAARRSVVAAA